MAIISKGRCPACAAKGKDRRGDNLAEYVDGFYCWSCGYRKSKRVLSRFKALKSDKVYDDITLSKTLAVDALKFVLGYGLTDEEIAQFRYATELRGKPAQLLILLKSNDYWCGRNFGKGAKYMSSGVKPYIEYGTGKIAVLVEDVLSAIKVGRQFCAIPMLGAKIPRDWLHNLAKFDKVVLWGDLDKATDNMRESRKLQELTGKPTALLVTHCDPKCYNNEEIKKYIETLL